MLIVYQASFDIKTPDWDGLFKSYTEYHFTYSNLQSLLAEPKGSIYRIYFPQIQKSYIGQTIREPRTRLSAHKYADNSLGNALRTHQYEFSIVLSGVPRSFLDFAECFTIKQYQTLYPQGFNFQLDCKPHPATRPVYSMANQPRDCSDDDCYCEACLLLRK